jgi:hypothetical protein
VDLSQILYLERGGETVTEPKKKKWNDNRWKSDKKRPREKELVAQVTKKAKTAGNQSCKVCGGRHSG